MRNRAASVRETGREPKMRWKLFPLGATAALMAIEGLPESALAQKQGGILRPRQSARLVDHGRSDGLRQRTERRRVQFFLRRDANLALADCGRGLAAQRDAVLADHVGAHSGFSWLVRRPAAASGPTHALFAAQSPSIVDNLVALLRYRRALDCSPANCMRLVLISRFTAGFWYQADALACLPSF